MLQFAIIPTLLSSFIWGTAAEGPKPVTLPQTPTEVAMNVERVTVPCVAGCDAAHYAYIVRDKE